ncbi:MAG TPA: catalase family protein [Geminicoccus sp.]|uniref:catalase family protein n=1 Tax=Geminicoccus sp. TaxID=2024832 RepID=UPI002E36FF27|nr:catalase family protein [Geminicoccus sp.]HEX2525829.1 catalase family protein [Geminicoccus sp.]
MHGFKRNYVRFDESIETIAPDEQDVFDRIVGVMTKGGRLMRERYGRQVRTSHAKHHGLLKGRLEILEGLPDELRQGLFAEPRTYPVVVRLAQVPGEILDDRSVSTPRGMAIKVLDVPGQKLAVHDGELTQDFVLDTGKVFIAPTAKAFLAAISLTEAAAPLPEAVKGAVSATSRAANAVLGAVGLGSANLDFFGHPVRHPLAEPYFTQAPIRYGEYVAKLGVWPAQASLHALAERPFQVTDENGLLTAVSDYFRDHPAEYEVRVQLCTDLERMPVEDASTEWPEDESPYQTVARMILPPQNADAPARRAHVEDVLSFCPAHSLAAHRPLGSIMRARMRAYETLGTARRLQNGMPAREPRGAEDVPD